jgi:DNA (cytosine-5)-methyltransferase 1
MNHLSLFSGVGGIDLAATWAGFETVAFCEQNKFCQQVLAKHWPGVPIFDDIFTLTAESLEQRGIRPGEIKLISGGFPCQPYSHAGKRMGNEDDRALWPQMFRVIKEVRPDWVLGENVAGLISMALDGVLSDLESAGYTCQPIVLPACAINAPHRRDRVFIVAFNSNSINVNQIRGSKKFQQDTNPKRISNGENPSEVMADPTPGGLQRGGDTGSSERDIRKGLLAQSAGSGAIGASGFMADPECQGLEGGTRSGLGWASEFAQGCETIPNTSSTGREELSLAACAGGKGHATRGIDTGWSHWAIEPNVGRVATRVSRRVDRLRALGNAVVPQQIYPILKAIADYETEVAA